MAKDQDQGCNRAKRQGTSEQNQKPFGETRQRHPKITPKK
jgi:hypothetical protein